MVVVMVVNILQLEHLEDLAVVVVVVLNQEEREIDKLEHPLQQRQVHKEVMVDPELSLTHHILVAVAEVPEERAAMQTQVLMTEQEMVE